MRIIGYAGILVFTLGVGGRCSEAESPAACAKDEVRGEDGCYRNPRVTRTVKPDYPSLAHYRRIEGAVTLRARVETDGSVSVLEIVSCTNEGHGFEAAARKALKKWRYEPGTKNGKVVAVEFTSVIEFSLE